MKYILIISLALTIVGGCATQAVGPNHSSDEMAALHGSYWGSLRWNKAAIGGYDGTEFGMKPVMMVKLLPGEHSIRAICFTGFDMLTTGMMAITRTINFQAEAEHSYQVRCGSSGSGKTFWIVDKSSGEVVGGTAPP
jgi:hypothetical protein